MKKVITDGASAVGEIAYLLSEVIPIYPITPSSPMAEFCSKQNSIGQKNIFGEDVKMIEMQSEAGVAGTLHGALLSGAYATTFTSSQGLLLMIPNMYKMAGENLPAVIHVSARAVASHALSIFCDHSDVMATRMTGFLMLSSSSVQESADMAVVAHALAMKSSLPVLHFLDGFRTSHEIQKINMLEKEDITSLLDLYKTENDFTAFKNKDRNFQYGSAQNPDVFFQNREAINGRYENVENNLKEIFDKINALTGSSYSAFEFYGNKNAENVIVAMGSACKTIEEYIDAFQEKKIGLIKVRLYRPFFDKQFIQALPRSVKTITVLDRTKENGAIAPLAEDVMSALSLNEMRIKVLHGRYGLGGKEFTPKNVHAVFNNMSTNQKNNFTVGIVDDKSFTSLEEQDFDFKSNSFNIKIFGLGSDGSVSASKATIKILGENYDKHVQGYFEYDSKKAGSLTISHLRISDSEIKSEYLLSSADIVSINNFSFVHKYNCIEQLKENGIVLINSIFSPQEIDKVLPENYVKTLQKKKAKLYLINAQKIASECGLGQKINIIMQTALFKCASLLPDNKIREEISKYINSMFSRKGQEVVNKNLMAMEKGFNCQQVDVNSLKGKAPSKPNLTSNGFYNNISRLIDSLQGNEIKVSSFSEDGSSPLGTTEFEKRAIALRLPKWIKENCIQCGQCVLACPHSALRAILTEENCDENLVPAIGLKDKFFKILLSPEDCTGCGVCAKTCPAIKKALEMKIADEILEEKKLEYEKASAISQTTQNVFSPLTAKGLQFNRSLFEFPGACAGCGQTPYIKILTMLNGSNMMIANATGCSSIYAGTYGFCPYKNDENGNGITWANSLFEDNAEFGLGIKLGNAFGKNKDKKVWIIGGDGWAYDIGFGGLDHILASGEDVNILVLDNQTYSNTGGQQSKATPTGASVKFAENGKEVRKKDLGMIAMTYKDVFVAQVCLGANMAHTIKALSDAQNYKGVSLVIAYSPCVNQGYDMSDMMSRMKQATECGFWPIYVYNPETQRLTLSSGFDEEKYLPFLKQESRFYSSSERFGDKLLLKQIKYAKETINYLKNMTQKNDN